MEREGERERDIYIIAMLKKLNKSRFFLLEVAMPILVAVF
jgi:hypothetical protein